MRTTAALWFGHRAGNCIAASILAVATALPAYAQTGLEHPIPSISWQGLAVQYDAPDTLKAPDTAVLLATLYGVGVQIYEVRPKATNPNQFEWAFVAPEATLYGADNFAVGRHYGGPTWESNDGSTVVGRVLARQDAPDHTFSIPWLLLANNNPPGPGLFGGVRYVQRLNTSGGQAPSVHAANLSLVGQRVRVPYSATYLFYGTKQSLVHLTTSP